LISCQQSKPDDSFTEVEEKATPREGELIWYYPDSTVMDYKYFIDYKLVYYRRYYPSGISKSYGGSPIINMDSIQTVSFTRDTAYTILLKFIEPPNCKFRAMIGDYEDDGESAGHIEGTVHWCETDRIRKNAECVVFLNDTSSFTKVVYWSLEDTLNGNIQKNQILINFKEKEK
jgi:hypothetical protein